jgi:hypothetical protein
MNDEGLAKALCPHRFIIIIIVIIFAVLGLELRAYTLSHSTSPFFVIGIFEIGSYKLFAQTGFEP